MNNQRQLGITLLELMFAVTILAIVLGIGVPSFVNIVASNRMAALNNDVISAIHRARSEAVKQRTNTVMCPSDNPTAVVPACGVTMTNGWIVFTDANNNGVVNPPTDLVILAHEAVLGTNLNVFADGGGYMSFASTGFAQNVPALGVATRNVLMCDDRGHQNIDNQSPARAINMSVTGRPQMYRDFADVDPIATALGGCP